VPLLLGPVFGPVVGGAIVGAASWRWIFFINVPVGAAALVLALRLLPDMQAQRSARLDVRGLALLSGGIALFLYGLDQVAQGGPAGGLPLAVIAAGLTLIAAFCGYALRATQPLIELRLFARRGFAAAAAANLTLGTALFGVALLLPLYLEIVRGRTPLETGVLLIPQGLGAALVMPVAGALTDRAGARRVVIGGIIISLAGALAYTRISATSPYPYLAAALLLIGAGLGATITPSMAAAFQSIDRQAIPAATAAIGTIQRIAGSIGTVVLAVTLQRSIAVRLPGYHGGVSQAAALAAARPASVLPAMAQAFGTTFWMAVAFTAVSLLPALFLPGRPAAAHAGDMEPMEASQGAPARLDPGEPARALSSSSRKGD
jgi:EmrB/QacA subfamily drug resistance transporter